MLRCGHLFLFACGCVVPQPSTPGHWIQLSRSDHGIPAIRNGISTPTACLPAFCLAHRYQTTNGMPCPATACEPESICVVPCTPSSLCTCKLACQTLPMM